MDKQYTGAGAPARACGTTSAIGATTSAMLMAMLLALAACGGGGGGGSDGAPAAAGGAPGGAASAADGGGGKAGSTAGAGATDTPVPTQTTLPSSSYAGTDDKGVMEDATFAYLNAVRLGGSAGALNQDSKLDVAARAHSAYTLAHPFEFLSDEMASHSGFTGATAADRIAAAGYTGTRWGEGAINYAKLSGPSSTMCARKMLNSMYGMAGVMGPYRDLGIGYAIDGTGSGYCVLDFAYPGAFQFPPSGTVVVYPYPGQPDAAALYRPAGETPTPPAAIGAETGQPIYASMGSMAVIGGDGSGTGSVETFSLTGAAGNPVPAYVLARTSISVAAGIERINDASNDAIYQPYSVFLVPKAALQVGATYQVHFAGHFNGVAHDRSWSFTTTALN